ncbi:hypothetical protein HPT25_10035 [Bacillus sp. BRMEA1]|uniref:hypothetical protein n=1 Tax=Neobacillus endophyticus TaxID=2738405 RepID=UPI001562FB85|nr:hypothetical protein [Neobacillus endophyticus]NRD77759.1 hypothetical protein [Neobacillus endophyticus]
MELMVKTQNQEMGSRQTSTPRLQQPSLTEHEKEGNGPLIKWTLPFYLGQFKQAR